jgi:hypothetical protein
MKLSTFPTFLAFLTQKPCFAAPVSNPWHGWDIPPCVRHDCLGPPTAGPEGDDLSRRSESASAASSLRRPSTRKSDCSASASVACAVPLLADGT